LLNQIGDRVIAGVARRLKEAVPENCLLARYGGDEALNKINSCQCLCYDLILMDIELGRGFAVVAEEVRKLAEHSLGPNSGQQ